MRGKKTFLAKSVVFKNHTIYIESTEKIFLSIQRTPFAGKPWDSSVTFGTCFIESYCSINSSRWEQPCSNICELLWLKPLLNELVFHVWISFSWLDIIITWKIFIFPQTKDQVAISPSWVCLQQIYAWIR